MENLKELLQQKYEVEFRKCNRCILIGYGFSNVENGLRHFFIGEFNNDLTHYVSKDYDIMKIYDTQGNLVWERKEAVKKEYTDEDIQLAKAYMLIGYEYIARDDNGDLFIYMIKPYKTSNYWDSNHSCKEFENNGMLDVFTSVTWKDEEPTKLEDIVNSKN